jgi:hypothetical protein
MSKALFEPALLQLPADSFSVYGPTSFQDYLKTNGLPYSKTAEWISIDSYERLHSELKKNHAMVLRLGCATSGTGTQFCLVRAEKRLHDFFLMDDEIFMDIDGSTFLPSASMRQLYAYQLLPTLSESSLVNLGLSSGLISFALNLNERDLITTAATGRSTYSFKVRVHSEIGLELMHNNGQVDIDALFLGNRNGRECLFVLEAKCNENDRSLAKHKLVYPILSFAPMVPKDMQIIPVYVRILEKPDGLHYHIVECDFPNPRKQNAAINELTPKRHQHLILPMFTSRQMPQNEKGGTKV